MYSSLEDELFCLQKELQEVEQNVATLQSKLQQAQMRHRRLECKTHALKARSQEATDVLAAQVKAAADLAETPAEHHQTTSAEQLSSLQLEPRTCRHKHNAQQSSVPQPIASYKHCDSVAYAEIAPCMLPSHDCTGPGFNLIQRALEEYQRGVSIRESLRPQEICWFIQFPYAIVPDFQLSYSAGLNSPECTLTISLCYSVASAECMFLALELEAHEAAKSPGAAPPVHAFVKECQDILAAERKGRGARGALPQGAACSVPATVLELVQRPPEPDPEILAKVRTPAIPTPLHLSVYQPLQTCSRDCQPERIRDKNEDTKLLTKCVVS